MKTDKLLHLVQQKKAMRSGGALPLPKAQKGIPNSYLPGKEFATGAVESTISPIDLAVAAMSGTAVLPSAIKLSKNIINTGAEPTDKGWLSSMALISQGQLANNLREAYENLTSKQKGGLTKAQNGLETLVAQYKDLQNKINKGYGKKDPYVKKLREISDKLVEEGFVLEESGKVPESILNWRDPEKGTGPYFCIGTACYLANEAGDPFSYYSNTMAQDAAKDNPESTRYLEQSEKYIEPGDIIQYKNDNLETSWPYHAYTILDIGKKDEKGFKPVKVVGSKGTGAIQYKDYYLGPDNKIYSSPSDPTPMATQLLKRKSKGPSEYNQIVSKRDELKKAIEAIEPDYFNPKPTIRSTQFFPTDFLFNRSGWYGGNPENYSYDTPDRERTYALGPAGENRFAEQIYAKEAKLPEILSQISSPEYKKDFMKKHNITSREYDAIAKNMLGIYGAESKFGTDYWGTNKLPEPQGLSKMLGIGSVGPFQINRKSLSKDLRKKYSNEDLHDPIKSAEATMEFLAEGLTPKGMNLRRRAKLDKDSERYMQNVNPENYLEYLSYLHNQPKWLTGDKSTMRTEGDIVAGEHPYKKLVDYYSGLFDVLPSSIPAPVEIVGEAPVYEWKRKGGLIKAQNGLNTGFITYSQNPEYFDSKAVLSDNPEWNDKLKQLIYQGKAAYNPNTGAIQFIDSPAAPADIQQMATKDYTEGVRIDPTNPAYAGADDRTRQIIEQSTQEAYQNPLMYAPGTIGMAMLPGGFQLGYGLSQGATQAGQGNYGTAALTAGLSMLPAARPIANNYVIPTALQSSLASRLLAPQTLENLVAKNVSLANAARYNPVTISRGAFGEAAYLQKFPNIIIKKSPSYKVFGSMGEGHLTNRFEDIPQKPGQLYPKYYKSESRATFNNDNYPYEFEVMSRVAGKPIGELSTKQLSSIPKESWNSLLDELEFLRQNDVGFDMVGANLLYDPKTKQFGLIDLTPGASKAKSGWQSHVLGDVSVSNTPQEAKTKLKESLSGKLDNIFSRKAKQLAWRNAKNITPNSQQLIINSNRNLTFDEPSVQSDDRYLNWTDQMNDKRYSILKTIEGLKSGGLTSTKAREILHDKSVHGHPLTDKQRKYFGWVAGGKKKVKVTKPR